MTEKDLTCRHGSTLGGLFDYDRLDRMFKAVLNQYDDLWTTGTWDLRVFEDIQPKGAFPKVNVLESDEDYMVEIAVAGFSKDDIELELKENTLYIKGELKTEANMDAKYHNYLKKEIAYRSFRRAIRFPRKVDTENISCSHENGIIKCNITKLIKPSDEAIKININ